MKPAPFGYARARSVAHAVELLAQDDARLLAGGQSLIATLNMRLSHPAVLVDINGIGGLDRIAHKNGHIEIGALVRHVQAERSPDIARHAPLIARAMPHIGHPAIRNRGTVGGSLVHADPSAELPVLSVALDAIFQLQSLRGKRSVAARDFYQGYLVTDIASDELLIEITLSLPPPGAGW